MSQQPPPIHPGKCRLAATSLTLGISSFFCLGFLTAIPAMICGVMALIRISKSGGAMKGTGMAVAGLCTAVVGGMIGTMLLLGAFLAFNVSRRFRATAQEQESPTSIEIKSFCQSLELYYRDTGAYPATAQGLQALVARPSDCPKWDGPYLDGAKIPDDPWGHPYIYRCPGARIPAGFDLFSAGPDGKEGTDDDVGNW
jgi:general secretion pathway protein G